MRGKSQPLPDIFFQKVINDNFTFIERQCSRAVRLRQVSFKLAHNIQLENEALELCNRVLDHLAKNNYQVLRKFQHKSRLSTYLTAIIANQAVDMIRKKRGRSREKERAEKYGRLGEQIIQKIVVEGMSAHEAYKNLKAAGILEKTEPEFESIVADIRGKRIPPGDWIDLSDNPVVKPAFQNFETGEIVLTDSANNPEKQVLGDIQRQQLEKILREILNSLSGEDKLILRMKYPFSHSQDPEKIESISRLMGISQKAVYKRINRILRKCRSELKKRGISFHDLL
jgi:RNA polymerase sigma factor (sigma-70 family)